MPDATNLRIYSQRVQRVEHAVKLGAKRLGVASLLQRARRSLPLQRALELGRSEGWEASARHLLSPEGRATLGDSQLAIALTADLVRDVEVELLLTEVRKQLLLGPRELLADAVVRAFAVTLIRQCDLNEYVFYVSEAEGRRLAELSSDLAQALRKGAWDDLMLITMYVPVREIAGHFSADVQLDAIQPETFGRWVRDELANVREEQKIAASIQQHGEISDEVSRLVASQYEVNPYPRWTEVPATPGPRCDYVRAFFTPGECAFLERPFNVLVAGCATGREAVRCGLGYGPNASVLGIDMTRASLVYAQRMAKQKGATNVRFLRSDIMNVPTLPDRFDIIESQGVLHHMADPLKGWKALVDVLKPGGLMYIALYTRLGRHQVNACRQEIAERGLSSGRADQIREYRRELILRHGPSRIWLREEHFPFGRDFFSLSNCRDLLFHVHEHQFTIPELKDCFAQLGLRFGGFAYPPIPPNSVWPRFPDPKDLDAWWAFEQRNPETFAHCYEFWCRKDS